MKRIRLLFMLPLTVLVLAATGCWKAEGPGSKEFLEIEKLRDDQAKLNRFQEYPIDIQIDVFMFAAYATEGAGGNYQGYLAYEGSKKVVRISERIAQSTDWYYKMHLISVVVRIQQECGCARSNPVVMKNLRNLNGVDDGSKLTREIRDTYMQFLNHVEGRP